MKTENETSHVTLSHAQVKTTGVGGNGPWEALSGWHCFVYHLWKSH